MTVHRFAEYLPASEFVQRPEEVRKVARVDLSKIGRPMPDAFIDDGRE